VRQGGREWKTEGEVQNGEQSRGKSRELMVERMPNRLDTGIRAMSDVKRKLASLLKIILGRVFAYEDMIVLETSSQHSPKPLPLSAWPSSRRNAEIKVRLAAKDDVPKFDRFEKITAAKARERFEAGHFCFIAEENGRIVNYTWVCFYEAYIDELELRIRIDRDSAYRYDGYTDPEYRGMGILPKVLMSSSDYLFRNGIKTIYDLVGANNFPSIRSHQKIGSRKMGQVTLLRLFKSKRYRCEGETPEDFHKLKQMFSI